MAAALSETLLDFDWLRWPRAQTSDASFSTDNSVAGTRALGLERRTTPIIRDVAHETLVRSNAVVYAYRSTLLGDNLLVIGRGNTVIGHRCRARGSDNVVYGPFAMVHGARSASVGVHSCAIRVGGAATAGVRLVSPRDENREVETLASSSDSGGPLDAPLSLSGVRPVQRPAPEIARAKSDEPTHRRRRRRRRRRRKQNNSGSE